MKKKNKKKPVIQVRNISKVYTLHHEKPTLIENILYRPKNDTHVAIDGLSFDVFQGDRVGIIGANGSGKTTLLKIIAGITKQQTGTVKVNGRVVSLIDLSAGFHPDLTGEENIFLNGLVIGMSSEEITTKKESIIEFADIGKFIDAPLYTYSSGMQLRLGFSIAIHSDPDILLLDEGFAVGDEQFRKKVAKRIKQFKRERKTLVMVSHWIDELAQHCTKFLWMEKGKLVAYGGKTVTNKYLKTFD